MKKQKIELNFELANIQEYNDGFLIATCPVFHAGNNRNRSNITEECAEKMMSKSAYVPVVAEFKDDSFGSHGGKVVIDDEGIDFVDTTTIIGCVLAEPYFMEEIDGKNYYCVKVALYKEKYAQIEDFLANHTGQSMEISVLDGNYDENEDIFYISEGRLDALCVLGTVQPCFKDSAIRYSLETEEEAKAKFEFAYTEIINKVKEVFEADETPEEDESFKAEENGEENSEEETVETGEETPEEDDFAQDEEDKEKCEEEADEETEPVEETDEETTPEDTEEEEEGFSVEEYKALVVEYSNLEAKYNALNEEVASLREFKAGIEKEEKRVAVDEIASKFNLEEAEISELKNRAYEGEISLEVFEDKLFSLMGRKLLKNKNFSKEEKKTNISKIKVSDEIGGEFGSLTSLIKK